MGWWRIDTDALADSRFVVSALAETTAAMMALRGRTAGHPADRDWLARLLPGFQAYLAAEPVAAEVLRAALGRQWIADFLTPPPDGRPFEEELESIRATPDAVVRTNLRAASRLPEAIERARGLGPRTAELLEWVWAEAVRPDWERRRRVAEADILVRTRQLSLGGWSAALSGMRPGMAWLGEGRLRINLQQRPPRELSGEAGLVFVPVTPRHGWVSWRGAHRHALVYPCEGQLTQSGAAAAPQALVALLGPVRARVLVLLESPKSTTQLVALTGLSLGAVAGQLKVLLAAGLILRRRTGRTVLYGRVAAGDVLVSAAGAGWAPRV
ncbi:MULTISPECIES: helix-turn-helix domain-containing protein [unclassified Streptomyces]|uniref:helix-turn-helix domain-containing protein n=1 Tax=unclassified Streptomyces TaxID=2593676 RepID=UPI002259727F|nr:MULTISPECIES: helix-turn-helix domain-containing protein [unclassified Streptomyces]MCX4528783.1 winged helix-turn-helix domain-containing protein [Streptomyces sp. NBC_01551]MCX4540609.1 winged helix-turn-helix domain-containing protein [Streptomyces sp. NBC_01565]